MKRRITLLILTAVCALCIGLALGGCSKNTKRSYDYLVKFDYNLGDIKAEGDFSAQYLGVFAGSRIMAPCKPGTEQYKNSDFKEKQIPRYEVRGWYLPATDENGEPVKENGSVALGKKWDFTLDRVNENLTLYASLAVKPTVRLVSGDEVLRETSYVQGRVVSRTSFNPLTPKKEGHTFYDYYADPELTRKFTFPFTVGDKDITVYAKFIEGENWSIVKTVKEFNTAFHASAKIYLDADLDFTGAEWKSRMEFAGEINGNKHTISNITCPLSGTVSGTQINFGMFGVLRDGSSIHDIAFKDVQVTISTVTAIPVRAALFAWTVQSGAKLENVTVSGRISKGSIYQGGDASLYAVCCNGDITAPTVKNCDFSAIVIDEI